MNTAPGEEGQGQNTVAVGTDSTTYLPKELIERWGIEEVSLYVGWGDDHRPEHEYDLDDFYKRLRESDDLPSTSQPSVGDFLARFEPLTEAGRDVVSIHIASGLSGTYESASEAARGDGGVRSGSFGGRAGGERRAMMSRAAPSRDARKPGHGARRPKPKQLPTGRHGLPPEVVVENQRTRLLVASAEVLAERGYSRATTQAIADRAGVSKRTLYEQFSDVWDCLSAAYAMASDQLCEEISGGACADDGDWPGQLSRGVDATLAWAAENPDFARLLSGEPPPTVETLRSARRELTERLATQLRTGRSPDTALPEGLEERLIDAALSLVAARLMAGSANTLLFLGPELTEVLLRPYRKASRS